MFAGTIPTEFGLMISLRELYLQNNELAGARTFPAHSQPDATRRVFAFGILFWFDQPSLLVTGPLPSQLGALSQLHYLRVVGNKLTGAFGILST